jgi:hypothetical protein
MTAALWMLFWNSVLFFFVGRWSVIRGPRYRMGDQVVDDIQGILDKRPMIGDNGMVITNRRKWRAFGYDWIMTIAQDQISDSDRQGRSAPSSTLPQG